MTCLCITVVRKRGLKFTCTQFIQNINAALQRKCNFFPFFSQFSTSGEKNLPKLKTPTNIVYPPPFPLKFPCCLVITYLSIPGAAQFLRFPPTWIYQVIQFGKAYNKGLQNRNWHPSAFWYKAGLYATFHTDRDLLPPYALGSVKNVAPYLGTLLLI